MQENQTAGCCSLGSGPLDDAQATRYAGLFKVRAEPNRLRILAQLAAEGCAPLSVNDLTAMLGLSQPTVSHHLQKLTAAGLLERRRRGRHVVHTVCPGPFAELRTVLQMD